MISSGTKSTTLHETEILESLDFDFEQPCEHSRHTTDDPAKYYVIKKDGIPWCTQCGTERKLEYFCCQNCWDRMGRAAWLGCVDHLIIAGHRDDVLTILYTIGT